MVNVLVSMLLPILPRATLKVGFQLDGHLGDIFLVPTIEQATRKTLLGWSVL